MSDVLDLPFDQYQRYGLVAALLESVRAEGESFVVLDVGGRTALLREFLPKDRVELVDVVSSDVEGLVLGSGAQLPFKDDSFDVVAAFDTLEHVPPALRGAFVSECARVSRRYVMLAGPYDSPRVAEAEQHLLDFLKVRLNWEHRYLAEHRENGLPDAVQTRSILRSAGATVEMFGHGALDRWLLLMMLELYVEHEGLLQGIATRLYRFYNEHLFRSDHGSEVYRHAIVGVFGDAPMPHLNGALDPPGSAPKEATQRMIEMGAELLRYDAMRDTYLPEIERMHAEVTAATKNAEEHHETLGTVQRDLEEHRSTVEALRAEVEKERAGAQAALKDRDETVGGLQADLEGHRALLADLKSMREAELAELAHRGEALEAANQRINALDHELQVRDLALHDARVAVRASMALETPAEGVEGSLTEDLQALFERRVREVDERDAARGLLVAERERAEALAVLARRPWNLLWRVLTRKKLGHDLAKERGPITF